MEDVFQNGRCLIVEDFEQMRVSFKGMLSQFGVADIETVPSGETALKSLAKSSYDVVVCDYNLGDGKDGQQVLEEARHLGYLGHASTFFMVTAESHMPMVLGALEHQPDEYMIKPINPDAFQHRLSGTLRRKKKLHAIDQALSQGEKELAIAYCAEHTDGDLKHRHYLSKLRAELCIDIEFYDEAEKIYQELLTIRDFPWAHFGLGKIDYFRQHLERAESRFLDLIEKNRHYLEAYDWVARVQEAKGQTQQAQQLLQQAVKLAPKSVSRQRRLGQLAHQNGDDVVAERAFHAAVRWGKTSCFATVQEYLELAAIYKQKGQYTKQIQLLAEGITRFVGRPLDHIQVLSRQAAAKRTLNSNNDIDPYMRKVEQLASDHSEELPAETLLAVAEECYRIARPASARVLLSALLGNHHDDLHWVGQVRQLMNDHDKPDQADQLIEKATKELLAVQSECSALLDAGEMVKAIERLNETVDKHPANRTLALAGVKAMIAYMINNGAEQGYQFRCRRALERLLKLDSGDQEAMDALVQLSRIAQG